MNKSIKSALLSALVFPGAGHFYLKKYVAAVLLSLTTFIALYFIVSTAVQSAHLIVDKIQRGEIKPDFAAITDMLALMPAGTESWMVNVATVVLLLAWVVAIVDCLRVGRQQDRTSLRQ